jgi:hypothetical protein
MIYARSMLEIYICQLVGLTGSKVLYFQSPRVAVFLDRRETSVLVLFPPIRTGCPLIGAQNCFAGNALPDDQLSEINGVCQRKRLWRC